MRRTMQCRVYFAAGAGADWYVGRLFQASGPALAWATHAAIRARELKPSLVSMLATCRATVAWLITSSSGDGPVAQAPGDQRGDLALPRGQRGRHRGAPGRPAPPGPAVAAAGLGWPFPPAARPGAAARRRCRRGSGGPGAHRVPDRLVRAHRPALLQQGARAQLAQGPAGGAEQVLQPCAGPGRGRVPGRGAQFEGRPGAAGRPAPPPRTGPPGPRRPPARGRPGGAGRWPGSAPGSRSGWPGTGPGHPG